MRKSWEIKLWRAGAVPLLEARVSIPLGFHPKIDGYYLARKEHLFSLCEGDLPVLQASYEEDPDPRKRFRYRRQVLTLSCEARVWGEYLLMWEDYCLKTPAGQTCLGEMQVFSLTSGLCVPRACAVKRRHLREWQRASLLPKTLSYRRFLTAPLIPTAEGVALRVGEAAVVLPPPE